MRLSGKRIIVTGSTTGIGEAIARRCVAEGGRVLCPRGLTFAAILLMITVLRVIPLARANSGPRPALELLSVVKMAGLGHDRATIVALPSCTPIATVVTGGSSPLDCVGLFDTKGKLVAIDGNQRVIFAE